MPAKIGAVAAFALVCVLALAPACVLGDELPADPAAAMPATTAPAPSNGRLTHYFYEGRKYGSEQLVHPLRTIVNGGLGILQLDNRDDRVDEIDFKHGWQIVSKNVGNPIASIENEGWDRFLKQEIAPFSTSVEGARYWPNYTLHVVGGGMSYRLCAEWFDYHGSSHPRLLAAGTIFAYHVLNEVVEGADYTGYTTDPVADLMIFDPLGIVLFEFEGVSRFFGKTLSMAEWSYQPIYDPVTHRLENVGQNFVVRYPFPGALNRWSLMYTFGTHGEMGLSKKFDNGDSWSFCGGFGASTLQDLGDGVRTVDLVPAAGLFWDRHNSLMASLLYAKTKAYQWRLNLYPGVLPLGAPMPGLFVAASHEGRLAAGVTIGALPGIPVGIGGTVSD
jgi:hypothetical protein